MLRRARHAVEYAALLGLRESFRHLAPQRAVRLGARIGARYARAHGPRTSDAELNLALAFPDWSAEERARVLEASFANLGRHVAEMCLLQGRHRERLLAGVEVEGHENYETARKASESGGIIVATAHFGAWELCAAAMAARGYPVSVVHHGLANPLIDRALCDARKSAGIDQIRMGRAATGVFRALSDGRAVAMLLDQNARRDEGVFAPFFGVQALTRSGPLRLAASRAVAVMPVFMFRVGNSSRHRIRMGPPLEIEQGEESPGALERNVARVNAAIEAAVCEAPDHWLWAHRRFRSRPEGEPSLYPPRRR